MDNLYTHQSKYHLIEVFGDEMSKAVTMDKTPHLTTLDYYRYTESLAIVPYLFTRFARKVLILGAGFGLTVKKLLDVYESEIESLTLVEIDPEVVEVGKTFFDFPTNNSKVKVAIKDAWDFMQANNEKWDLILADYSTPLFPYSERLYTKEHISDIHNCLRKWGVFAMAIHSLWTNPMAASCIIGTVASEFQGKYILPYRVHLPAHPPPGEAGFVIAAPYSRQLTVPHGLEYLNDFNVQSMFWMNNDEMYPEIPASTIDNAMYARLCGEPFDRSISEDI